MKLTTKLLLGATVVAGLSVSAFAACATDVDMGAKKLTNVADGTADGDAVNYGQVKGKLFDFTLDANTTATFTLAGNTVTLPNGETYKIHSNASAQIGCTRTNNYATYAISVASYNPYRSGFSIGPRNGSYGALSVSVNPLFNTLTVKDTTGTMSTSCRFSIN